MSYGQTLQCSADLYSEGDDSEAGVQGTAVYREVDMSLLQDRSPGLILTSVGDTAEPGAWGHSHASVAFWTDVAAGATELKRAKTSERAAQGKAKSSLTFTSAGDPAVRLAFRFGKDGKRILEKEADLRKILAVVHRSHQGSGELFRVVQGMVSVESDLPEGGLRQACRQFVSGCAACDVRSTAGFSGPTRRRIER